jgi:hypothetical protein
MNARHSRRARRGDALPRAVARCPWRTGAGVAATAAVHADCARGAGGAAAATVGCRREAVDALARAARARATLGQRARRARVSGPAHRWRTARTVGADARGDARMPAASTVGRVRRELGAAVATAAAPGRREPSVGAEELDDARHSIVASLTLRFGADRVVAVLRRGACIAADSAVSRVSRRVAADPAAAFAVRLRIADRPVVLPDARRRCIRVLARVPEDGRVGAPIERRANMIPQRVGRSTAIRCRIMRPARVALRGIVRARIASGEDDGKQEHIVRRRISYVGAARAAPPGREGETQEGKPAAKQRGGKSHATFVSRAARSIQRVRR